MINRLIILLLELFSKLKLMFTKKDRLIKLPYVYRYLTLPIEGLVIGLFLYLWYFLAHKINSSALLFSVIAFAIPIFLTRNIYIDRFLNTLYAIFSSPLSASNDIRLKKLEVAETETSRAGTVCGVIYTFFYLFLFLEFYKSDICPVILIFTPIISRLIGLLLVVTIKSSEQFREYKSLYIKPLHFSTGGLIIISVAYILLLSIFIYMFYGLVVVLIINIFTAIIYFILRLLSIRFFDGITDDTLGFNILSAEPLIFSIFMLSFMINL